MRIEEMHSKPAYQFHLMMTHFLLEMLLVLLLLAHIAKAQKCTTTCGSGKLAQSVQYPFGFSDGCTIRLNCSKSTGGILISDFKVQSITSTSIFLNLPEKCYRPVESMKQLFGSNFGPTRNNSLLFQSCQDSQNGCYIPAAFVQKQFALDSCRDKNDNITCLAQESNGSEIVEYHHLVQTKCKYLFGSIAVYPGEHSQLLSLEFETVELGWWVLGSSCDCSNDATCTKPNLGEGKSPGFRCQCREGYHGDGYRNGSRCRRGRIAPRDGAVNSNGEGNYKEQDNDGLINVGLSISVLLGFITGFWGVCGSLVLHNSWRNSYFRFLDATKDWVTSKLLCTGQKCRRDFNN